MNIVLFLISILIFLIALLLTQGQRISMLADVEGEGIIIDVYWLKPFIKVNVLLSNVFEISVYLFKLRIYHSPIRKKKVKKWRQRLIKSADISDIEVDLSYSFNNPFLSAMTYGIIAFTLNLFSANIDRFTQHPVFFTSKESIHFSASGYLNLGQTISNYLSIK